MKVLEERMSSLTSPQRSLYISDFTRLIDGNTSVVETMEPKNQFKPVDVLKVHEIFPQPREIHHSLNMLKNQIKEGKQRSEEENHQSHQLLLLSLLFLK